jgi:HK97 family phage portal protein
MGFLNLSKQSPPKQTKHPTFGKGDETSYIQGSSKPTAIPNLSTYQNSVERLDTAIRTLTDIVSPARHSFYRKGSDGKLTRVKTPKQFSDEFTNDYQSYVEFNTSLFATLFRYNGALIIPESSSKKTRKGMVDFFVVDNNKWFLEAGSGQSTIDKFTYRTTDGTEIIYNYDDVIYVLRSYDITNPLYGIPKITSLNRIIQMELSTTAWAQNYTAQGGKKSIIAATGEWLSETSRSKITEALNNYLSATEAKVLLLDNEKLNLNATSDGLDSGKIIELMTSINNSIMESFRIPPELLGKDLRSINDKSLRLAARMCFELNINPLITAVEAHFTRYIQETMGLKNIVFKFDRESIRIFDESEAERQEIIGERFSLGLISPNEARISLGLEPIISKAMDAHYPPVYLQGGALSYEKLDSGVVPENTPSNVSGPGGELNGEGMSGSSA